MCAGVELQECGPTGEYTKKACASEALCSAKNKSCNPMQCGMDAYTCEGPLLKKCKPDLSGFDDGTPCVSAELCDDANKRCNECLPNSKVCMGDTPMVCSADGKGPTPMPCAGATPKCNNGKCVQCTADADCAPMECRVASCNMGTGMCAYANALPKSKCMTGVCSLLGNCVECVDDENCPPSKACGWDSRCTDRRPLTASAFLGACSLTLNAGFNLNLQGQTLAAGSSVTASEFILPAFTITSTPPPNPLVTSGSQARTYNIAGPADTTCSVTTSTDNSVTLTFSGTASPQAVMLSAAAPSGR
jgi:hypothetical protein